MMRNFLALFFLSLWSGLSAQTVCDLSLTDSRDRMMQHIAYLASDELEGRYPGTEGAEKALSKTLPNAPAKRSAMA